jgi:hypothetical protein
VNRATGAIQITSDYNDVKPAQASPALAFEPEFPWKGRLRRRACFSVFVSNSNGMLGL